MNSRVFAVAIDAAEWTFLERWLDDGTMPWLASFVDASTFAETDNVECYRSEYIWTQLVTAQPWDVTRYWGIEHFDPKTYTSTAQGPYWGSPWYAGTGLPTIVFDCPQLAVLPDIEGIQVAGWGAHGAHHPRASSPTGLLDELDARHGPHPALGQDFDPAWFVPGYIDALADWCIQGARARAEIMRELMAERPDWRLFLTCMSEFHIVGHNFWHGIDESHPLHGHEHADHCRRRYAEVMAVVDEEMGRVVESLDDEVDVMVFALHGMWGADDALSMALVPELVARLETGAARLRVDNDRDAWVSRGCPPVVPDSSKMWAANTWMRDRYASSMPDRVKTVARRLLPERVFERIKTVAGREPSLESGTPTPVPPETRLTPAEIRDQELAHESVEWQAACWYRDLFPTMRYFALPTFTDIHLRINLKGREANGLVDPADYEAVCDEAIAEMQRIIDPRTGASPIRSVHRVRADDPMAEPGPDADIMMVIDCPTDSLWHPAVGMLGPIPFQRTGAHSPHGWLAARGPSFEPEHLTERRPAADIARTMIDILGVEPPPGAEGVSLPRRANATS
ncbi:MAG TPA: hypothetical protein VMW08_14430 [Acidimicrobiales bacterium]|nr:hypothetical protein [Acidimicrobiales bacterium]